MLLGLMQPQVAAASSGPLWQIGDPAITANTGQCGVATYPTPTSADFVLLKNSGCMRNQLNPIGNGGSGVFLLNAGQTYTWSFQTVTGDGRTFACGAKPWFNFGPYMWDWTNRTAVSSLTQVGILFKYMQLTSP
jgi:hypothetical protein